MASYVPCLITWSRNSSAFMELASSLSYLQQPTTGPCPEPDEFNPKADQSFSHIIQTFL